jgi:aspartyl-tRNA(Asn)/glutamyl-tRNA(Gln) amidotransferase subunit C
MPADLSLADVERIAALAHLALTDAEKHLYRRQLAGILAYARLLAELDTSGVDATSHVLAGHPASRADEPRPPLGRADVLAAAPEPALDDGLFKVPRVLAP